MVRCGRFVLFSARFLRFPLVSFWRLHPLNLTPPCLVSCPASPCPVLVPPPLLGNPLLLQLDALVAVAHDIPALYLAEHSGEKADHLGADDFLPIFIFVLVNSRVEGLAVQSAVLEALCDPKKMMGEAGELILISNHAFLCPRGERMYMQLSCVGLCV